jgi:hypothetical protein
MPKETILAAIATAYCTTVDRHLFDADRDNNN